MAVLKAFTARLSGHRRASGRDPREERPREGASEASDRRTK